MLALPSMVCYTAYSLPQPSSTPSPSTTRQATSRVSASSRARSVQALRPACHASLACLLDCLPACLLACLTARLCQRESTLPLTLMLAFNLLVGGGCEARTVESCNTTMTQSCQIPVVCTPDILSSDGCLTCVPAPFQSRVTAQVGAR